MSAFTTDTPLGRGQRPARTEFRVYFGLIFAASLPIAAVEWTVAALRGAPANRGMVARAWSHAREIAPMIFAA